MQIVLNRLFDNEEETLGIFYYRDENKKLRYHFNLEDEYREKKVKGETRIPSGHYSIKMRKEGGYYERLCKHSNKELAGLVQEYGLPWLQDVPEFEYILIHPGNTDKDTEGCLLPGMGANNFSRVKGTIGESVTALIFFMRAVTSAVDNNRKISIIINDMDKAVEKLI